MKQTEKKQNKTTEKIPQLDKSIVLMFVHRPANLRARRANSRYDIKVEYHVD